LYSELAAAIRDPEHGLDLDVLLQRRLSEASKNGGELVAR
jgi:hypothetical protein